MDMHSSKKRKGFFFGYWGVQKFANGEVEEVGRFMFEHFSGLVDCGFDFFPVCAYRSCRTVRKLCMNGLENVEVARDWICQLL